MEEDFEKVADLIHESINVTQFICSKLDGGAKAPLKVREFLKFQTRRSRFTLSSDNNILFRSSKKPSPPTQKSYHESKKSVTVSMN